MKDAGLTNGAFYMPEPRETATLGPDATRCERLGFLTRVSLDRGLADGVGVWRPASGRGGLSSACRLVLDVADQVDGPAQRGESGVERSEEHTSELQSQSNLVCRLLLE